jgi:hypothetical protein
LAHSLQAKGFGTFARFVQNSFVALGNCFMTVSQNAKRAMRFLGVMRPNNPKALATL